LFFNKPCLVIFPESLTFINLNSKSKMSNSFCDLHNPPKVVILEDDCDTIKPIMEEIIEEKLEWMIEFVETGDKAVEKKSQFYILDIKLGEGQRKQEGMTTAEKIKESDESAFVSLFSGTPNLKSLRLQARRIGVDYIEEKSNLRVNICNIVMEMLHFYEKSLLNCFKKDFPFEDTKLAESIIKELENICEKTKIIYKLEQQYHDSIDDQRDSVADFDENIKVYEEKYKKDREWFNKYEGKYVAFANGEWLGEDFVADSKDDLFKRLDESDDYKDQALFYTCVKNDDILEDDIKSIPRLSSAVQMKNWKF
jgi:hypothetical protein